MLDRAFLPIIPAPFGKKVKLFSNLNLPTKLWRHKMKKLIIAWLSAAKE
jgi:hypothetical protein